MILGLTGKTKAGKDTVADYLVKMSGFLKFSFSENLKRCCIEVFNLSERDVFTQDGKQDSFAAGPKVFDKVDLGNVISWMRLTHPSLSVEDKSYTHLLQNNLLRSPREILQFVGTDIMRYYCKNYHFESLVRALDLSKNIVISDVRFPNEAKGIQALGGSLVRVIRNPATFVHNILVGAHSSENSLDAWEEWDFVLENNGKNYLELFDSTDAMLGILEKKNAKS